MAAEKGNNYNPYGRPQKPIDWKLFEELCFIQCTQSEIASVLKLHPDTVREKAQDYYQHDFSTIYKELSEGGKASMRRTQLKLSQKNTAMSIWLGKQYLGQKDNALETMVHDEVDKRFNAVMDQLSSLQKASIPNQSLPSTTPEEKALGYTLLASPVCANLVVDGCSIV